MGDVRIEVPVRGRPHLLRVVQPGVLVREEFPQSFAVRVGQGVGEPAQPFVAQPDAQAAADTLADDDAGFVLQQDGVGAGLGGRFERDLRGEAGAGLGQFVDEGFDLQRAEFAGQVDAGFGLHGGLRSGCRGGSRILPAACRRSGDAGGARASSLVPPLLREMVAWALLALAMWLLVSGWLGRKEDAHDTAGAGINVPGAQGDEVVGAGVVSHGPHGASGEGGHHEAR